MRCEFLQFSVVLALAAGAGAQAGERPFSVDLGLEITSAAVFRGYVDENQGLIAQPSIEFSGDLVSGDGGPVISAYVGNWNSLHSEKTEAVDEGRDIWYESDIYGGVILAWERFELDVSYTFYTYPSSEFETVQEIGVTGTLDLSDAEGLGALVGAVSVGAHWEIENSNYSDDEAAYIEVGLGPSIDVFDDAATFSVPLTFGLSLDDYYVTEDGDDDVFGFFSVGVVLEWPLGESSIGETTLTLGGKFFALGNAAEEINDGNADETIAFVGVSLSF